MGGKKGFLTILLIFWSTLSSCASMAPLPSCKQGVRVAVIGMKDGITDQKIAAMLMSALAEEGCVILVEREKVNRILEEQSIQSTGLVDAATAVRLGNLLDAEIIVAGELVQNKAIVIPLVIAILARRSVTISAQVINGFDGKLIAAVSETGSSYAGGTPIELTYGGKTRQDILGSKKSAENMFDAAIRDSVDKITPGLLRAIYAQSGKRSEVIRSVVIQ